MKKLVGIVMGSQSDKPLLDGTKMMLRRFEVDYEEHIISAHRSPDSIRKYAETAEQRGVEVIIAAAGKAAHLPGVIASMTVLPVIGVPVETSDLGGLDSLLSIVQMPKGVPVATVAIGGTENAGILAAQILALKHADIREKLRDYKAELASQSTFKEP